MATPDNRAIAAGETLDLDPVRRATYEARIAASLPPDPQPWYYQDYEQWFPDKILLHLALFDEHTAIFRGAPFKFEQFSLTQIRLLETVLTEAEMFLLRPTSPTAQGEMVVLLTRIGFSFNMCCNLMAAKSRLRETMQSQCSQRVDSPWPRSQRTPPAQGDSLGESDWKVKVHGSDVTWTKYEQTTWTSQALNEQFEPHKARANNMMSRLTTMATSTPPAPQPPPPQNPPLHSEVGLEFRRGFQKQQAMTNVRMTFQPATLAMQYQEWSSFQLKANDYVSAMGWSLLPPYLQHEQCSQLFNKNFWTQIIQRNSFLQMPENKPFGRREAPPSDKFLRWNDWVNTHNDTMQGALSIANYIWKKANSASDDLTVINSFIQAVIVPFATNKIKISNTNELASHYIAAKELFERIPDKTVLGEPEALLPVLVANSCSPDVIKEIRKQMKSAKGTDAVAHHGRAARWNHVDNNPAQPVSSLRLPTWKLLTNVFDKLETEARELKVNSANSSMQRQERLLMASEDPQETLLYAGKPSTPRSPRPGSRTPTREARRDRPRTPSMIRPRSSSTTPGGRRSRSGTPAGPRIHPSYLRGWCHRCAQSGHEIKECLKRREDFKCTGEGGCGNEGHMTHYCFKKMLADKPHLKDPKPGTPREQQLYASQRQSRRDDFQQKVTYPPPLPGHHMVPPTSPYPPPPHPPRAASAHQQDILYYAEDINNTTPSAPLHTQHYDRQGIPTMYPDSFPTQLPPQTPTPIPSVLPPQQVTQAHPPPPARPLHQRHHTPGPDLERERYYRMEEVKSTIPSLHIRVWPSGRPQGVRSATQAGSPVIVRAVTDTGSSSPLLTSAFARSIGCTILELTPEEASRHAVHMGDCEAVQPVGKTIIWMATTSQTKKLRRRRLALVMPKLPENFLIGTNELKLLGLLPKAWPHHEPLKLSKEDVDDIEENSKHPLDEEEKVLNACLYAEGKKHTGEDDDELENEDNLDIDSPSNRARCVLDDAYTNISKVDMIPGYGDWLDEDIQAICDEFSEVFQKRLSAKHHTNFEPMKFHLKKNFKPPPRARGCRPTPAHWRNAFDQLIDSMLEQGQIRQILPGEPVSQFLSKGFLVKKPHNPSEPRFVIDYSGLKDLFERNPFPQRDPITIFGKLRAGCRNYFVADMSSGYHQIRLQDGPEGSDVTTFVCDRGVFKWLVLPMGCHPASDELSSQMQAIFAELFRSDKDNPAAGSPMVRDLDDFLGGAATKEELCSLLRRFLSLCAENGVYLNPSKFRVAMDDGNPESSVNFAGIRVRQNGTFEVDPDRLESIRNYPRPRTRRDMQRWLGLANSLGTFQPPGSPLHTSLGLQRLLLKNTTSNHLLWTPQSIAEFEQARVNLSSPSSLHPFDPNLQVGMLTDVAKTIGMGIILFQFDPSIPLCAKTNFHLMGVWSIAAKPNWKDLSPIETEILGFSQGYKKLSYYVMGAPVIHGFVDHKPFVELYHRKDMDELSPRMLRLMHDILEQPFKMTWLDRKNDFILAVDALSRAPTKPHTSLFPDESDPLPPLTNHHYSGFTHTEASLFASNSAVSEWISEDQSLTPLYEAAKKDDLYQQLCDTIEHSNVGYSRIAPHKSKSDIPKDNPALQWLHRHRKKWAQMGILRNRQGDRLIWLDGEQVFVPQKAREGVLQMVDCVHNGGHRATNLATRSYWWPDIIDNVKSHCDRCHICQMHKDNPPKEICKASPVPPQIGWSMGMDFAEVTCKNGAKTKYLILTDYLSGWSTYFHFSKPPTTQSVTEKLSTFFHLNTWPAVLACDAEGILNSEQFRNWMKNNNILRRQNSSEFPQSNGLSEAAVKIFKRLWSKHQHAGSDFIQGWSMWLDTPRQPGELSPTRQWFGRPVRHPHWYTPAERNPVDTLVSSQEAYIRRKESSGAFRLSERRHAPRPTPLAVGGHVLIRDKQTKLFDIPAVVYQLSNTGRGARVRRSDTGVSLLRNRSGIKLDPSYSLPIIAQSESGEGVSILSGSKGYITQKSPRKVSFATHAEVAEFETVGIANPAGGILRVGLGSTSPCDPVAVSGGCDESALPPPRLAHTSRASTSPSPSEQASAASNAPLRLPARDDPFYPAFLDQVNDVQPGRQVPGGHFHHPRHVLFSNGVGDEDSPEASTPTTTHLPTRDGSSRQQLQQTHGLPLRVVQPPEQPRQLRSWLPDRSGHPGRPVDTGRPGGRILPPAKDQAVPSGPPGPTAYRWRSTLFAGPGSSPADHLSPPAMDRSRIRPQPGGIATVLRREKPSPQQLSSQVSRFGQARQKAPRPPVPIQLPPRRSPRFSNSPHGTPALSPPSSSSTGPGTLPAHSSDSSRPRAGRDRQSGPARFSGAYGMEWPELPQLRPQRGSLSSSPSPTSTLLYADVASPGLHRVNHFWGDGVRRKIPSSYRAGRTYIPTLAQCRGGQGF